MPHKDNQIQVVRYGELRPCRTAFIDTHTPGSDQKENFTIIGAGVSESDDQHVHIKETPGFNIGAAGQPPKCCNSLHSHETAEVFFVAKGRWRFFWGRWGNAGEVVLEEGDIFNIPTGVFRGFENIGSDYGMIMSILGGDHVGRVTWAPQVIKAAQEHGLILGENGTLYDTKKGESLPSSIAPMPTLSEEQLQQFTEPTTGQVVLNYVARFWDLIALSDHQPVHVIGEHALLRDKPGFEVDFLSRDSITNTPYQTKRHEILMPVKGHWRIRWENGDTVLNPGDCCAVSPGLSHSIEPSMTGYSAIYRIRNTDDEAGVTWNPEGMSS